MIIDCISDLHGNFPALEGGDLLIVAGDLTARNTTQQLEYFLDWLRTLQYKKIIFIAGNHDTMIDDSMNTMHFHNIEYLCDSDTEFEGFKIWGSPWTHKFPGQNPHAMAFALDSQDQLMEKWKLIPTDTDILVTHGPRYGILDKNRKGQNCGSESLATYESLNLKLKLHVFGHIHEAYGKKKSVLASQRKYNTIYVNASHVNEMYDPVNRPIRVIL